MKYNPEEFGEAFHTGFRKCLMDTDADAIVWNVIHLLKREEWAEFTVRVCTLEEGTLQERCLEATEYFYGEPAKSIFHTGIRMISNQQWEALEEWMEAVG